MTATVVPAVQVRPTYVLQQVHEIYAMAYTQLWELGTMDLLLDTTLPVYHLNRLWVPVQHRRRHYGHTLLQHICQDADRTPAILTLQVQPDDPAAYSWIRDMYLHAGFIPLDREEYGADSMVRWHHL